MREKGFSLPQAAGKPHCFNDSGEGFRQQSGSCRFHADQAE
jgi:hypothetical protein